MKRKAKVRRQRAIRGHQRAQVTACVEDRIERAIRREMARYNVSRSYVLAIAAARHLGVELPPQDVYKPQDVSEIILRVLRGGKRRTA